MSKTPLGLLEGGWERSLLSRAPKRRPLSGQTETLRAAVWPVEGLSVAGGPGLRFSSPTTDQRGYLTDQRASASFRASTGLFPAMEMSQLCETFSVLLLPTTNVVENITLHSGSLGSRVDEERS